MENYLQPYGTIKAVTISDDVMIVSMSGMNLQEISAMFEILQQQPIVKAADLTIASTEKTAGEDLDFSVTITLQPADTAEGEKSLYNARKSDAARPHRAAHRHRIF